MPGYEEIGTTASVAYTMKYIDKPSKPRIHSRDDRARQFPLMSKKLGENYLTDEIIKYHLDLAKKRESFVGEPRTTLDKADKSFGMIAEAIRGENKNFNEFLSALLPYLNAIKNSLPKPIQRELDKRIYEMQGALVPPDPWIGEVNPGAPIPKVYDKPKSQSSYYRSK